MPIEIKITDLENLTQHDLDFIMMIHTREYLHAPPVEEAVSSDIEQPIINLPVKKRKKRDTTPTENKIVESLHLDTTGPVFSTVGFPMKESKAVLTPDIPTHEDLIALILENTRTQKITFTNVMEVLAKYNAPPLNELADHPLLIRPIYEAIKELTE